MKLFCKLFATLSLICAAQTLQYPASPTSEMSIDEKNSYSQNKTVDNQSGEESSHEVDIDEDKKFLVDAMKTILDPNSILLKNNEEVEKFKYKIESLYKMNSTIEDFMQEMDKLSLEVCKTSQESLWSYVTDTRNEVKKNKMIKIAAEEDEIKKQYWNILKSKYLIDEQHIPLDIEDPNLRRKIRIIKERGTNVQMPQSKQREEIDTMQRIWSRVTVCAYNSTTCHSDDSVRTLSDVITIFKKSNNSKELAYYWKEYRDTTGKKIRPIFKDYIIKMNQVARSENFTDAGEMWRYAFEDENFIETVDRIWSEIKPLYDLIHDYVRAKLKHYYEKELDDKDNLIPAHILGNLWAQEWQAIYPKVVAYPDHNRPHLSENETIDSKDLFDAVAEFQESLGFESARDSYEDVSETTSSVNCLPSSHDMCDGVHYKIKWCGEKITDLAVGLSRAARLLGHVQYFKHYRNLTPLYRDGPNPAFHDAISDIVAVQLTTPNHLKKLNFVQMETGSEATMNHLLWLSLEKFPLIAYAYVLDKWRWDVFGNSALKNWNQHWWDLRTRETGISPPMARNESDLDPAAKYHVVSHVQYITYLVSHVLEFQILLSMCKHANHTGPLHECSIHGVKEAGKLLSDGMSLGASEDWRTVLKVMTGQTELSTEGILSYFSPLQEFLVAEKAKQMHSEEPDMDKSAPILVGIVALSLTIFIVLLYLVKKQDLCNRIISVCGIRKNGSLDIVTNESPQSKCNEVEGIIEDKV